MCRHSCDDLAVVRTAVRSRPAHGRESTRRRDGESAEGVACVPIPIAGRPPRAGADRMRTPDYVCRSLVLVAGHFCLGGATLTNGTAPVPIICGSSPFHFSSALYCTYSGVIEAATVLLK